MTLLVVSLTRKTVPDMTYTVFGGTLNLTQSFLRTSFFKLMNHKLHLFVNFTTCCVCMHLH